MKNAKFKIQNGEDAKTTKTAAGLLTKVKANAAWNGLTREKRATLEHWLFEEGLSYNAALERAKSELGFTGSRTSLRRFYEHARSERLLSGLTDTGNLARTVEKSDVSVERLRSAGLKLAAEMFLRTVASAPEKTQDWAPLAKLLLQAERNEAWRRIKEEENGIRERALELARVRFEYATIDRAMKALPQLNELQQAKEDPELSELEENKQVNEIRRRLFGQNLPMLLPETEEELANPEILRAKERAINEKYKGKQAPYREVTGNENEGVQSEEKTEQEDEDEGESEGGGIQNEEGEASQPRSHPPSPGYGGTSDHGHEEDGTVREEGEEPKTDKPWSHDHGHGEEVGA